MCIVFLVCIYNLTDDETFNLWNAPNVIFGDFYSAVTPDYIGLVVFYRF